jgi:tripartite-type tricarboxylate transporter receptor subunit TctC
LRGLAVTAEKRMSALPDVPAMGELGHPGLIGDTFQGLFARAGTPQAVTAKLHEHVMKALAAPDVRERMIALGFDIVGNTPEQFAAQVKNDIGRWGKVIRDAGIKAD